LEDHVKRIAIVAIVLSLVPLSITLAQEVNPVVIYQGHEIEVEPEKGVVQGCVVQIVTTENLDGSSLNSTGIIIARNSDQWIVTGVFNDTPQSGAAGSHVGDCWHLEWDAN
jgi:hypothetical protein